MAFRRAAAGLTVGVRTYRREMTRKAATLRCKRGVRMNWFEDPHQWVAEVDCMRISIIAVVNSLRQQIWVLQISWNVKHNRPII